MTLAVSHYLSKYKDHLLGNLVPFWERTSYNPERKGLDTCLDDDGSVISHDRYMWSQLRALWVFSALYNRIMKKELWRQIADHIFSFIEEYGRDAEGNWNYRLNENGEVLDGSISVYADGFAIYGLTEYYRASGNAGALKITLETFNNVKDRIKEFDSLPTHPYNVPLGCKAHGVSMLFSLAFNELSDVTNDEEIYREALYHTNQILYNFYNDHRGLLFEIIKKNNENITDPAGMVVVPGHVIESSWFQLQVLKREFSLEKVTRIGKMIRNHLEIGWDMKYGGIFLAVNPEGNEPPEWENPDTKPWWPQCEALVALIMYYENNNEAWCIEWFERIDEYIFSHYPNYEYGDWYQNLNRKGVPVNRIIGLPVKDIMHHIRAFIYCINMFEEMEDNNK